MKKLLLRLLLLLLVASALQFVLVPRLRKMKDLRRFEACFARNPDVVMFCDSTNAWVDAEDRDPRAISDMLSEELAGAQVEHVTRAAYHLEVYAAFVDLMAQRRLHPSALVIPINLRSFSPEWDRKPAYQFEVPKREIRNADDPLRQALSPLLRTLNLLEDTPLTQHEYKTTPVYRGEQKVGLVRDFDNPDYLEVTRERTRNKMIFHYMYPLQADHPKLAALRAIVDNAREHDLSIVFYVTPIDVQTGEELLPGEFQRQVERNVNRIREALGEHRPALLDLSQALPSSAFSWHDYPNEHLSDVGRRRVASELAAITAVRTAEGASSIEASAANGGGSRAGGGGR